MDKVLFLVIPCYNEEDILKDTTKVIKTKMKELINKKVINKNSKVLYVNDGSQDNTWNIIEDINKKDPLFTGISLSKNKGQQNALFAGLMIAKEYADIIISMDADMQDDIDVIDKMIEKYNNGNEIVYGVRKNRKKDSYFKRTTALSFYKFMKRLGVDIIYNHADYRLASKRVLNELEKFSEINLFLRGIFPLIGFKNDIVYYERKQRTKGKTKYPTKKMLSFALDGITSFSIKPIRIILNLGIIIFILSLVIMTYSIIRKIFGYTVAGWTFIICSIWLIAGIQMLSLGIIGEYIGKIYAEVKRRPRYIIDNNLIK